MHYVELVAVLALLQMIFFMMLTGAARGKANLKAPATSGDEHYERMYRVQMNTIESMVIFLPALYLAGKHWSAISVAGIGLVFIIARFIYWRAYIANPARRSLGFGLSMLSTLALVILSLVGIILSL
jgi:uncharacterized MAPEG superfamily protein